MTSLKALHTLLATGRNDGHRVAHDGQHAIVWQDFSARVARHAADFAARDASRWLLASEDPLEFSVLFFALLHAGKQVVIPPNQRPATLAQLAAASAFDAQADVQLAGHPLPLQSINPATAIIDLYTSGSSGAPKRVRKTLAQFETEIAVLESLWGDVLGTATMIATAPHHHIYGLLFRLLWPLAAGRPFDCVTCSQPSTLLARLATLQDCALVSSPAQLSRLPELIALDTLQPPPRIIFSSGGPLTENTVAEFRRQYGQVPTEIFGSTETGGIAWRRQDHDACWTPLPGIAVAVTEEGALSLRSPFLAVAVAVADTTPWHTDDAAELQPDGRFRLLGRLDRVVKIEEKRLSLPEIEARLDAHPWVAATAATALAGRRKTVGAALVLSAEGRSHLAAHGRRATSQALRRHLAAYFEDVLLPRRWRFLEQLPFNDRGKLPQATLTALFAGAEDEHAAT